MADERTTLKRAVDRRLTKLKRAGLPIWYVKIGGGLWQRVGLPDYIGVVKGRFFAFELKHPERPLTLTPLQKNTLTMLKKMGAIVSAFNDISEFNNWTTRLLGLAWPSDGADLSINLDDLTP